MNEIRKRSIQGKICFGVLLLIAGFLGLATECTASDSDVRLNVDDYDSSCGIAIEQLGSQIVVTWRLNDESRGRMSVDLAADQPLVESIALSKDLSGPFKTMVDSLDPILHVRVGERDLEKRGGWTIFFDRMQRKKSTVHSAQITKTSAVATSTHNRATLTVGGVTAGPFRGEIRWTFYSGSPFVLQEAVMRTEENGVAYLYDTGLACGGTLPSHMSWRSPLGELAVEPVDTTQPARSLAVHGRTIGASFNGGALAIFPPPHRYFYPLDFSNNYKNLWLGLDYDNQELPFGFGIRHDPQGDNRYVPWFNAPPNSNQAMGAFLYLSNGSAESTLDEVARLTRNDRFAPLEGHTVFSSHYHVEHTQAVMNAQSDVKNDEAHLTGHTTSGKTYQIPKHLENPGFVRTFKNMGVDIVHLAEFHFGETPRWQTEHRLRQLEVLHAECERLSDENFLLLPGEEPNVHLGGHWISFFPKPVNWVLNRPDGTPFVTSDSELGQIYHVGSDSDVLKLLEAEGGLAWTAHARIKSSTGFPDRYRQRPFFTSDQFLGAAWKAMPADLSQPRLGLRVLDLMDDMANWGDPKYVLGEVDVFKIEPDHELYAHMNVNYLRLDDLPRFEDGWQPVIDALQYGRFFVTTGEILIPQFTVSGKQSGETASLSNEGLSQVQLDIEWTFPLAFAEVISGDGSSIRRHKIDLTSTESFGTRSLSVDVDLRGQRWVRVEVWDVAANGAFTQPVWLERR